jgi:Rad3-related DNA helicase
VADSWNHGYQFDPISPAQYAEKYLFKGATKVVIMSGTIRPRSLVMLGIDEDEFDFFDYPSDIRVEKSPLIYIPTVKVWRGSENWELKKLVRRIDQIFEARADRKGIVHTVSYRLRDFITANSAYSKFFVINNPQEGESTHTAIQKFKQMEAPAVLVSPSVTTGFDFPFDQCRYQIIAKMPWPDGRSKIESRRNKIDPRREAYQCMQTFAQAFGRGDRDEEDWQEVFVIDDSVDWFVAKNRDLAPSWLLPHFQKRNAIPPAPKL